MSGETSMMLSSQNAARAYAAAAAHRNLRHQDADVFRRANAALRQGKSSGPYGQVRALSDNDRLWTAVIDLLRDPANPLREALRASIISVGLSVQREMQRDEPDIAFLVAVNENIAAGLSEQG
jgi:flagellar protein FlaF